MKKVNFILLLLAVFGLLMSSRILKAADNVQSLGVEKLNEIDQQNMDLLDKVINSSQSSLGGDSNVTIDQGELEGMSNDTGFVTSGKNQTNISGTSGVALIEHTKNQQQTTTSNVGSVMSNMNQTKKVIERKLQGQ